MQLPASRWQPSTSFTGETMKASKTEDFHPSYNFIRIKASIYVMDDAMHFEVTLHAVSTEVAETYLRQVYPDISTIYVYEEAVED